MSFSSFHFSLLYSVEHYTHYIEKMTGASYGLDSKPRSEVNHSSRLKVPAVGSIVITIPMENC